MPNPLQKKQFTFGGKSTGGNEKKKTLKVKHINNTDDFWPIMLITLKNDFLPLCVRENLCTSGYKLTQNSLKSSHIWDIFKQPQESHNWNTP